VEKRGKICLGLMAILIGPLNAGAFIKHRGSNPAHLRFSGAQLCEGSEQGRCIQVSSGEALIPVNK